MCLNEPRGIQELAVPVAVGSNEGTWFSSASPPPSFLCFCHICLGLSYRHLWIGAFCSLLRSDWILPICCDCCRASSFLSPSQIISQAFLQHLPGTQHFARWKSWEAASPRWDLQGKSHFWSGLGENHGRDHFTALCLIFSLFYNVYHGSGLPPSSLENDRNG